MGNGERSDKWIKDWYKDWNRRMLERERVRKRSQQIKKEMKKEERDLYKKYRDMQRKSRDYKDALDRMKREKSWDSLKNWWRKKRAAEKALEDVKDQTKRFQDKTNKLLKELKELKRKEKELNKKKIMDNELLVDLKERGVLPDEAEAEAGDGQAGAVVSAAADEIMDPDDGAGIDDGAGNDDAFSDDDDWDDGAQDYCDLFERGGFSWADAFAEEDDDDQSAADALEEAFDEAFNEAVNEPDLPEGKESDPFSIA